MKTIRILFAVAVLSLSGACSKTPVLPADARSLNRIVPSGTLV